MKVTCEIEIGNNGEFPDTKVVLTGTPLTTNGYIRICIAGKEYEVTPRDLIAAIDRVRSDK